MFYCEKCRKELGYPESLMLSNGNCEICGSHVECYDMPSSHLPKDSPKEPEDYPEVMSDFISDMKSFSHTTQIVVLAYIAEELSLDKTAALIKDSLNK